MLELPDDHNQSEQIEMKCLWLLFDGRNDCGRRAASNLGQATTAMFMVAATRSSTLHDDADFN